MKIIRDTDIIKPFPYFGKGFFIAFIILYKTMFIYGANASYWVYLNQSVSIEESKLQLIDITEIIYSSNWLKAHFIRTDFEKVKSIENLSFVERVVPSSKLSIPEPVEGIELTRRGLDFDSLNFWHENFNDRIYRQFEQTKLIHLLHFFDLHNLDILNSNIGVVDAGFISNNPVFNEINIIENRNFTNENKSFETSVHGNRVLSLIGGYINSVLKTSGINCNFVLAKTEVIEFERKIEEYYLVHALEWLVDTMNVSMINISLGYSEFDNPSENYTIEDLDGNTTASAKAVNIAANKGALVFVAAGNLGDEDWKHITTPADANGAITVGSLTFDGGKALSSSVGIIGNTIKPDLMAPGQSVVSHSGDMRGFTPASGTSFASPIALSSAIIIKRIHPLLSNEQIKHRLIKTASNSDSPNYITGYGTINTLKAVTDSTTLTGFVLDKDSLPVNDALVSFSSEGIVENVKTATDGFWFIKIEPEVPNGGIIEIEKPGYAATTIDAISNSLIYTVLEDSPGALYQYANLKNERIISQVTAKYNNNTQTSFLTNYNGSFMIDTVGLKELEIEGFFEENQLKTQATLPITESDTLFYIANGYYKLSFVDDNFYPIENLRITIETPKKIYNYITSSLGEITVSYENIESVDFIVEYSGKYYSKYNKVFSIILGDVLEDTVVLKIKEKLYPVPIVRPDFNLYFRTNSQTQFSIYNSSGRRINYRSEYDVFNNFFIINTQNYSPGVYYIVTKNKRYKFLIVE